MGSNPPILWGAKKLCYSQQPEFFKTSILYFVNVMRFVSAEVMYDVHQVLLMPKS